MRRLSLLPAIALAAACAKTETPEQMQTRMQAESDSARTAITAAMAGFQAHFAAGHADSVALYYAADGNVLPPGMPMIAGRDSIRAMLAGYFGSGSMSDVSFQTTSVVANGPLAIERGTFRMTFTPTGGQPMPSAGKYLAHWHRIEGQWLMADDIWNDDAPPAPMPPARGGRR